MNQVFKHLKSYMLCNLECITFDKENMALRNSRFCEFFVEMLKF